LYQPQYGTFNVVHPAFHDAGDKYFYNLPTQIVGRAGTFMIQTMKDDDFNTPAAAIYSIAGIEMISADGFHYTPATCTDPNATVISSSSIWTLTDTNSDHPSLSNPIDKTKLLSRAFFNTSATNAAFKIRYLVADENGTLLTLHKGNSGNVFTNLPEDAASTCKDCTGNIDDNTVEPCVDCLRTHFPFMFRSLCSRDNFAIRPKSFRVVVRDINATDSTVIGKNDTTQTLKLAAGYEYEFDVKSTSFTSDDATFGYTQGFSDQDPDRRVTLAWNPSPGHDGCNDESNVSTDLAIMEGSGVKNIKIPNVGEYRYEIVDKKWTSADWDPLYLGHHANKYFKQGADCQIGKDNVPGLNDTQNLAGCEIRSVHDAAHTVLDVRTYPYAVDLSGLSDATAAQSYFYANNIAGYPGLPASLVAPDYGALIKGVIKAVGKDGGVLSNFVRGCYAEPVEVSFVLDQVYKGEGSKSGTKYPIRWRETNSTGDTNGKVLDADRFSILLDPGTMTHAFAKKDAGSTGLKIRVNIDRNSSDPFNPQHIVIQSVEGNCTAPDSTVHADVIADHRATGSHVLNFDHVFYYARLHAPDYSTDKKSIKTPIYAEVYATTAPNTGWKGSVDDVDWWINPTHTAENGSIVNLVPMQGFSSRPDKAISVSVSNNLVNGVFPDSTVSLIGWPMLHETHIKIVTQPWLLYHKFITDPNHMLFYNVEFTKKGGWAGVGKLGKTLPSAKIGGYSERIEW